MIKPHGDNMEYLVESHMGGYYISDKDPKSIEKYCEQCGDHDYIIISWKKGKKLETLLGYFSKIKISLEELENDKKENLVSKDELIDNITWSYDNDISIINDLASDNAISEEEKILLIKQVTISEKKQLALLQNVYNINGLVKRKTFPNQNN